MPRADLALALLLAAVTVASRIPFRARVLTTWDAVQFALALDEYDIVKHQPHPPGYILYVGLARAIRWVVGDPPESLVWLALLASAVAVFLLYRLAWTLYDRPTALVATVLLATSPLFWLHGVIALPYAVEAALASLLAMLAWSVRLGRAPSLWWSAVALGVAGGVRQSLLIVLMPLWLGMAWAGSRGRRRPLLGAAGLLGLTVAAWLVPMLWLSGGFERYLTAGLELYESTVQATTVLGPPGGWGRNLTGLFDAGLMGLGLCLPVLVWIVLRGLWRHRRWGAREWFLAAWILPPLVVYLGVHFGQPGYLLTMLPALDVLVARWLVVTLRGSGPGRWRVALTAAIVAAIALVHTAFFVGAAPADVPELPAGASVVERWSIGLRGYYRYRLWLSTAVGLREQEGVIKTYVAAIRQSFDPADAVVVTELGNPRSYPWFRHVRYYLPGFRVYHLRVGAYTRGYLTSERPESMASLPGPDILLRPPVRRLVWMVDAWDPSAPRPAGLEERRLSYGRKLYILPVDGQIVSHGGYRLIPAPPAPRAALQLAAAGAAPETLARGFPVPTRQAASNSQAPAGRDRHGVEPLGPPRLPRGPH
jgi:hypothetical protein